ncbi:hypothetical protein [Cellulomonas sp. PS-H5]|uniref:hypothetical protein n=1 Tax=Cellulomonas sp. PS-H5 TaxID=2820400 RepID=UPI001C4F7DEC|nr:hypothetical protein [Cellulomonas sp. PS-H5]MBW0253206.1 hypothetical protein [Cellulomonas sp. PS-H5]
MTSRRSTVLVVLVGGVLGAAAGAALARWVFHQEDLSTGWVIGGAAAVGVGLGDVLSGRLQRRRAATGALTGRFEGSVRAADGDTGLGSRWVAAVLDVDRTGVTVVRLALGMRPLRRAPVRLAVDGVRRTGRRTGRGDALRVAPGLAVLVLDVPGGTVEVAVEAPSADHLVDRLTAIGGPRTTP